MKIDRDAWLSAIFGYNVFKVSWSDRDGEEDRRALDQGFLRAHLSCAERAFYYAKVPTERVDIVQALSSAGFSVVDVNVTFVCRSARQVNRVDGNPAAVQDILAAHYDAVLDIAASCFVYSRFHLDPAIPNERANAIKRAWIDSYVHKRRGECLLVGLLDGRPVGFLAVLATTIDGESCRVIDLIGVDRAHQRRGVGKALVSFFIQQYVTDCALLRVGTQVANVPSVRLYESLGFRAHESAYVLHAHHAGSALSQ